MAAKAGCSTGHDGRHDFTLTRVMDNGVGMDEDDVLLSIERHATSKLRDEGQLDAIDTLGFRGEVLPSIASVSRMVLLSRPHDRAIGTMAVRINSVRGKLNLPD